jgi:protein-disulfide isomerase
MSFFRTMRAWTTEYATAILVICAIVASGSVVVRNVIRPKSSQPTSSPSASVPDWREYAASGRVLDASGDGVTIVVFADFECPFCRVLAHRLDTIVATGHRIQLVYRHLPSEAHPNARRAALGFECAASQSRVKAYHGARWGQSQHRPSPVALLRLRFIPRVPRQA